MIAPWHLTEIRSSLAKGECPICEIISDRLERFYFWFIKESYYNPSMMDQLKKSYGLCKEHTWKLIEAGRPYITGVMYEYLTRSVKFELERFLKEIRTFETKKRGLLKRKHHPKEFQRKREIFTQRSRCPACEDLIESEREAVAHFALVVREEDVKGLFQESKGLCFHHLLQVLSMSEETEAIFLIEDQMKRVRQLNAELSEFLRKIAYQYRNEPKGPEQTSWIRGAEFFVGKRFDPLGLWKRLSQDFHKA